MLNGIAQTHRTYMANPLVTVLRAFPEEAAQGSKRMQWQLFGCFDTSKGGLNYPLTIEELTPPFRERTVR
jgi:hypothetical protein